MKISFIVLVSVNDYNSGSIKFLILADGNNIFCKSIISADNWKQYIVIPMQCETMHTNK